MNKSIKCIRTLLFAGFVAAVFALPVFGTTNISVSCNGSWQGGSGKICNGVISESSSVMNVETIEEIEAVCITANEKAEGSDVGIVHSSVQGEKISFNDVTYIRYKYYYDSDSPYTGHAALTFKASEFNLVKDCTVYSSENVVSGKWAFVTFMVGDCLYGEILPGAIVPEFSFLPFPDAVAGSLDGDKFAVAQMQLLSKDSAIAKSAIQNGTLVEAYPINFVPGKSDSEGEMKPIYACDGEEITLPECEYTREGYEFDGWICSVGAVKYAPGDKYTVKLRDHKGVYETGRTDFIANWEKTATGEIDDGTDILIANYSEYFGGLVKPAGQEQPFGYADIEKNFTLDGIETLKLSFKPSHSDADNIVNLDGFSWKSLPFDIARCKCIIIPYYYKTVKQKLNFAKPVLTLLPGTSKALSAVVGVTSSTEIVANKWSFIVFKFDIFKNNPESINPNAGTTIVNQFYLKPFGENSNSKCSKLSEGDELYLGNFIFLSEAPGSNPELYSSFVNGYGDGSFKPFENLTNAEAAVMLAKAIGASDNYTDDTETAYSDISEEQYDWCRPYIVMLEKMKILTPDKGELFRPNDEADESRFLKTVVNAKSGGSSGESIGTFGTASGAVKTITRERAVASIMNLLRIPASNVVCDSEFENAFLDVGKKTPFANDIGLASSNLVMFDIANGKKRALDVISVGSANKIFEVSSELIAKGDGYISELDKTTAKRISEIRSTESVYKQKAGGKTYYVSTTEGSKSSDGLNQSNPLRLEVLSDVNKLSLQPGDVVLFKRGDTFRGSFNASAGVTYSAYGSGEKPILTCSPENGSGTNKWTLVDDTNGKKIWKYYREDFLDIGAINLIDGDGNHTVAYKEVPSYINGKFWVRDFKPGENTNYPNGIEFNFKVHLDRDLEFFHKADSVMSGTIPNLALATGPLYLRCDKGNPGALYPRIEFNFRSSCISVTNANGVTIDNLCIKYFGGHGIGAGPVNNLTVTNCEIGWGGGTIQHYQTTAGKAQGTVVRFGNGVEIYGAPINYTIDNCYVYEIYDAGITHQVGAISEGNYYMRNVVYTNNVLERSIYNIEYFIQKNNTENADGTLPEYERYMDDVYFGNNICRMAGYGWGVQRPDGNNPSNIKGWNPHNLANNFVIENNIFDRTVNFKDTGSDYTVCTGTAFESSAPLYKNNVFAQVPGRILAAYGSVDKYTCNGLSQMFLNSFGFGNKIYFTSDDKEEYSKKVIW